MLYPDPGMDGGNGADEAAEDWMAWRTVIRGWGKRWGGIRSSSEASYSSILRQLRA